MIKNVKHVLLATVTAVGLFAASTSAHAVQVLDGWNLNLSLADGTASDLTNIDHIVISGKSTVTQKVVGGSALGQTFTDTGYTQMAAYFKEGALIQTNVNTGASLALILRFENITGTLHADGTTTFDPGSGTLRLFLDLTGNTTFEAGDTELATFKLIAPSGGSGLDFFGGTAENSTVDVTLEQLTGIAGLFTDSANNPLSLTTTLHLFNVDALLDPNFDPNPDNTGVVGGEGDSIIRVQNAGQYNVAIPEPMTLALLGASMIGLGIVRRKRKSA